MDLIRSVRWVTSNSGCAYPEMLDSQSLILLPIHPFSLAGDMVHQRHSDL